MLSEFAVRFTGSPDLYFDNYRRPIASINFITAHDGFTLHDLVSYNDKHNEANGEDNKDGEDRNRSWNCGAEGDTEDPEIIALRGKQKRNLLTTLFLSQGVPMLVAGDERGRTQKGNNNAYCQDNEISWMDWQKTDQDLLNFTKRLIHFYKNHPAFLRKRWFKGGPVNENLEDIAWFLPEGRQMTQENWNHDFAKSLAVYLNGDALRSQGPKGEPITDDNFYIIFNAYHEPLHYKLPVKKYGRNWIKVLDTAANFIADEAMPGKHSSKTTITVEGRSVVVLKQLRSEKTV
jgi:glycogen operon protein